jgi:putative transposase
MVLQVCFSVFYAWKRGSIHVLKSAKQELAQQVKDVFEEHRSRYGAIRISKELQARGVKIGRHQTQTLMKIQGLKAIQPKSFVPKTTNSNHNLGRSPNLLLDRNPPTQPNEVFIGDITYIALVDGSFLYLATWLDMFSHKIVGWDLAENMRSILIINALNKAIERRNLPKALIVHSDGGGQYASEDFRNLLKIYEFSQSMTRKNNHYDNAMGESLFSRFKTELMQKGAFLNFDDAYTEIFEYIEVYYNRKRRHSSINYDIPDLFEEKYQKNQNIDINLG